MLLVCFLYHRVGGDEDDHMLGHAFSVNLLLVNEEAAPYFTDIGVASDEAGKG